MLAILVAVLCTLAAYTQIQLKSIGGNFAEYNDAGVAGQKYTLMISRDMNYVSRLTRSIMLGDKYNKKRQAP